MQTNNINIPTLEPTSGENLTITSSTCHLHQDDAFEAILPLLEAEGIEVISHDDRFVECPGQGLHTTPPELHYIYILSLFKDDDVVWIGRDLYDMGPD